MYEILERIYKGCNSRVYRAIRKYDSKIIIIKYIPNRKKENAKREIEHLRLCIGKKYIVQIIDSHVTDKGTYIILEDCAGGNLQQLAGTIDLATMKTYTHQILLGLMELKSLNICYSDLKPSNVLLDNSICKLCDLGSSQICKKNQLLTKLIGTPLYMSPEHIESKYNYCADMWSLGILIYNLLLNKYPWDTEDLNDIFIKIVNTVPDLSELPPDAFFFVSKCLIKSDVNRLTLEDALENSFIRQFPNLR